MPKARPVEEIAKDLYTNLPDTLAEELHTFLSGGAWDDLAHLCDALAHEIEDGNRSVAAAAASQARPVRKLRLVRSTG